MGGDLLRAAACGDGVQHLVGDQAGHVIPSALLGHRVEFRLQVTPAVDIEHRAVGRGGSVERQQPAGGVVVLSGRDDHLRHQREFLLRTPGYRQAGAHRRHGRLAQKLRRPERHHQQSVRHLRGRPGQLRAQCADVDRRRAEGVRSGVERRRHQGVTVELPAEIQPLAGLPGGEDGPQRADELTHPPHRPIKLGAVTLLNLGADLSAQAEGEPAPR